MISKHNRGDKPKGKFAQSNINFAYKGNASDIQSKAAHRSGGLQLVDKLRGARRNPPPPPWVPSLKAEMGGLDSGVNIVPPGGSGWGTGSANATCDTNILSNESDLPIPTSSSVLTDITKVTEVRSSDATLEGPHTNLVKPPQKPFFTPRSSKVLLANAINKTSSESCRPATEKNTGPSTPFYQRPTSMTSVNQDHCSKNSTADMRDPTLMTVTEPSAAVKDSVTATCTGWAATTEEPNFKERINFSDDEEELTTISVIEPSNEMQKRLNASKNSWSSSVLPSGQNQISFPKAAWDQSTCFSPVDRVPLPFSANFYEPNNDLFPNFPMIRTTNMNKMSNQEETSFLERFQQSTFIASEEQVQREERTLAYKSAINKAQMSRKKRNNDEDPADHNQSDSMTLSSSQNPPVDSHFFTQSIRKHGSGAVAPPGAFPIHPPARHSPHYSVDPSTTPMTALYNNTFPHLVNSVVPEIFHVSNPQIKPQPHMPGTTLPLTWNNESYSSISQPQFMHSSYVLSNSPQVNNIPRMQPDSDRFALGTFNKHETMRNGRFVHERSNFSISEPIEQPMVNPADSRHTYAVDVKESLVLNPIASELSKSHDLRSTESRTVSATNQEQSTSNISRCITAGCSRQQVSADTSNSHARYTSSGPSTFDNTSSQSAQYSHITPLMEVSLTKKWNENVFNAFPPSRCARGGCFRNLNSGRGSHANVDGQCNYWCPNLESGGRDNGHTSKDDMKTADPTKEKGENKLSKTSINDCLEMHRGYARRQRRGDSFGSTFPRQTRGRGIRSTDIPPAVPEVHCHQNDETEVVAPFNHLDGQTSDDSGVNNSQTGDASVEAASNEGNTNFVHTDPADHNYASDDVKYQKSHGPDLNQLQLKTTVDSASMSQNKVELATPSSDVADQDKQSQMPYRVGGFNVRHPQKGQYAASQRLLQRREIPDCNNIQCGNRHPLLHEDDYNLEGESSPKNGTGGGGAKPSSDSYKCDTTGGRCPSGHQQKEMPRSSDSDPINISAPVALKTQRQVYAGSSGFSNGHRQNDIRHRRPIPIPISGIVPLMSINAEPPPSYCENSNFLDSLSVTKSPVAVPSVDLATSTTTCYSEDGFMEVRSKSSKKQQAKLQQKCQLTSGEHSSLTKLSHEGGKMCDQESSKGNDSSLQPHQRSGSSLAAACNQASSSKQTTTPDSTKKPAPSLAAPTGGNAWLKPLQETINEKAAAAAAAAAAATLAAAQANPKPQLTPSNVDTSTTAASCSSETTLPIPVSTSYAWSVVVGSRTTTTCGVSAEQTTSLPAKVNKISSVSQSPQVTTFENLAVSSNIKNTSLPLSNNIPPSRQPFSIATKNEFQEVTVCESTAPVAATSAITATTSSANVCKVKPQKQPSTSANTDAIFPTSIPLSSKSEAISPMAVPYLMSKSGVPAHMPYYRRPINDLVDWPGKASGGYAGAPSSSGILDGFIRKDMEAMSDSAVGFSAAAALYLHNQQPFRQGFQSMQHQQSLMGFGLSDLSMRHQNTRTAGTCGQGAIGPDSYFPAPSFTPANAVQTQQPPRNPYHPLSGPSHQRAFPTWHQQHQSQQEAVMAAVAGVVTPQAATLWPSNYTTPPPQPHHSPYVGVIGADRPSSNSVSMASRLQSTNATASLCNSTPMRTGGQATGLPFIHTGSQSQAPPQPPSGLYESSPTHPTPSHTFDFNFTYGNGGGLGNSSNVFSHQSGAHALLASHLPLHQAGSARSLADPHPHQLPYFFSGPHPSIPPPAAISVPGITGPPNPSMATSGLHF